MNDGRMPISSEESRAPRQRPLQSLQGGEDDVEPRLSHDAGSLSDDSESIFRVNDDGVLDNPLLRLGPDKIDTLALDFVRDHNLETRARVFVKAARVLRNPESWPNVANLTAEEKEALESEQKGFWKQPKQLRVTIFTLAVAAVLQGWNQTSTNGANLNWPSQLGINGIEGTCQPSGRSAWIFAIINGASYLSAGLIGCWFSDPLGERFFGRRAVIFVSALIILASTIGGALARTWQELLVTRIILGWGMGMKASVVPVFAAEVAPAHIRGSLVMNWQLFDALGIFLGFTANLAVSNVGPTAWRWQIASSVLPAIVLISLIYVCPESPRFLLKRGHYKEAFESLMLLRYHPILAAKELFYIHCQIEVENRFLVHRIPDTESTPKTSKTDRTQKPPQGPSIFWKRQHSNRPVSYWQKLAQLFTIARNRRALVAATVVMISQILCGVNFIAFFSSTFFCETRSSEKERAGELTSLFLSWGIGLSYFVFAFPAYWLIDRKGRRWLLLVTIPCMALSMLAASLSWTISEDNPARGPVVIFFTYVFTMFYSPGMGPVPFTLSAEVFPLESRVVGMSFAVFCNLFGAGLLGLFVPPLTSAMGQSGVLGLFCGLNVLCFLMVFFFVPETAGAAIAGKDRGSMLSVSLEELNYIFAVPTMRHFQYQMNTVLPWAWRYYVLRERNCPSDPEKLYSWASRREEKSDEPKID